MPRARLRGTDGQDGTEGYPQSNTKYDMGEGMGDDGEDMEVTYEVASTIDPKESDDEELEKLRIIFQELEPIMDMLPGIGTCQNEAQVHISNFSSGFPELLATMPLGHTQGMDFVKKRLVDWDTAAKDHLAKVSSFDSLSALGTVADIDVDGACRVMDRQQRRGHPSSHCLCGVVRHAIDLSLRSSRKLIALLSMQRTIIFCLQRKINLGDNDALARFIGAMLSSSADDHGQVEVLTQHLYSMNINLDDDDE
jgi:hypothetical protein